MDALSSQGVLGGKIGRGKANRRRICVTCVSNSDEYGDKAGKYAKKMPKSYILQLDGVGSFDSCACRASGRKSEEFRGQFGGELTPLCLGTLLVRFAWGIS